MGAQALRQGDYARSVKLLTKSLQLYELPGVQALLFQAKQKLETGSSSTSQNNNRAGAARRSESTASNSAASTGNNDGGGSSSAAGEDGTGRSYTEAQVKVVQQVLRAKKGGRGAHYRVLGVNENANESEIKKAYRKLSLKIHPDKNPAPHADEAFKAVGLAYATLSDENKRTIYDRYGDEDPDNVGGNAAANPFARRGGGGGVHMNGQHVNPEDIFNMFFHGGGNMGGGGFGFGPGVHFYGGGFPNMRPQQQRQRGEGGGNRQEQGGLSSLMQFVPVLVMLLMMLFNNSDTSSYSGNMPGVGKYFSLTVSGHGAYSVT